MADRLKHEALRPYVPNLLADWLATAPDRRHRVIDGTAVFADLSGFTALTERLSRHGDIGAEEMSDALNSTFAELLGVAAAHGADLVKWGGDAVMLLFDGDGHEARACAASYGMRARLRQVGRLTTTAGTATLRMSVGVCSGEFHFFLVGNPDLHRELVICGPDVSRVARLESLAQAGEIAVATHTAAAIGPGYFGGPVGDSGLLLRQVPPAEPVRRLNGRAPVEVSGVLPVPIREHLLQGTAPPEHRSIAVAFVGFSGTDAMLAEAGPEVTAEALDEVVRNVSEAVAEYDVSFFESDIAVDGGKFMLTAGAPRSAGHDVDRMLRAARLAMDRAGTLPLRIGVNAGHVFSGDFGPPFRRTYSVKGDAINLAARLMARAGHGQVLATADAYAHSTTGFQHEPLEPFRVKGKGGLIHAVSIERALDSHVPVHAGGPAAGPLVGRVREFAVLTGLVDRLRARHGGVVQVLGEPGIGKSRLIAEAIARADGVTVLEVQCDEYASATPYDAFRGLLRELIGVGAASDPAVVARRLADRVAFDAPQLLPWLPLLGTPLGVPIPETPETAGLDEKFRKARLESVVGDFLHAALATPTLVTIDDAQHMDRSSADLLSHLVRRSADEPWLFVIGRRDRPLGWEPAEDQDIVSIRLGPLPPDGAMAMLRSTPGAPPLPRPTLQALVSKAAGNPLFLESLIAAAGRTGRVDDLPESIQELLTTQIDMLSTHDRTVLRHASVLGMRFDAAELCEVLAGETTVPDEATYERLGEFLAVESGTRLAFRHALVRDVAYEGLPYRMRWRLHEQVGLALERRGGADPGLLSMHFFDARHFEKAWRYACTAARAARAEYANHDAVELFHRAVAAQRRGPAGMVPDHELGDVLDTLADTLYTIGLLERAAERYKDARRLFPDDPVRTGQIVAKQADVDRRLRHLPQSLRRITKALRNLEDTPGPEATLTRAHLAMRYALTRFTQGRIDDALTWGERAVLQATESCDRPTLAKAYATVHGIRVATRRPGDLPYGELALEAYVELGDLSGQGRCLNNLAVAALDEHQWVDAADMFDRAADLYRRIGDTAAETNSIFNRADVLVRQGHWREAEELLAEVVVSARSVSDDELVALALREAARCACRLGEVEEAAAALDEARRIFVEIGEDEELLATDVVAVELLLSRGEPEAALAATAPLLSADPALAPTVHWLRGSALARLGLSEDAVREFANGIAAALSEDDRYAGAVNAVALAQLDPAAPVRAALDALDGLGVVSLPLAEQSPART